ncbi:MAG: hypothetical protein RLZZ519_2298 [Bacteroidota bacterium]|jgi:hypothetical protein
MLVTTLNPIQSNLRRIQNAYGAQKRALSKGVQLTSQNHPVSNAITDRLQELHLTLLGTMVSIQGNPTGSEAKEILDTLRIQILAFRKIKQLLSDAENGPDDRLVELAKAILIEFYDLEAILRKLVAGKMKTDGKKTVLIAAIASKSRSAMEQSLSRQP